MKKNSWIRISGQVGTCGKLEAFLGFAPAHILHQVSFADILNEDTGEGYQRPRNLAHSRSFRQYITRPNTSTISLTFNLRGAPGDTWRIDRGTEGRAVLRIKRGTRCLAQVDCQHRLSELGGENIPLAFMTFIGLDLRSEMSLFNVINSKAKGLSSSLTDYHESNLLTDLAREAPHLYLARRLNEDPESPWHRLIRYGGETTSGLKRRASLRMMQKSIRRFLKQTQGLSLGGVDELYLVVCDFWKAVRAVFPREWGDHRHHLLTKGIGLYSLMYLLADLAKESNGQGLTQDVFREKLRPLKGEVDWSSKGMFAGAGGQKGALGVYRVLRKAVGL